MSMSLHDFSDKFWSSQVLKRSPTSHLTLAREFQNGMFLQDSMFFSLLFG